MVEKPMAMNAAEAELMVAAAASDGDLMVAHCWRFHPDVLPSATGSPPVNWVRW